MFIGYFTERPYQDERSGWFGSTGREITDLSMSNADYDPKLGADLYNRYLDEKLYAEAMGFDGLMLNEHHSHAVLHGPGDEPGGRHPRPHHATARKSSCSATSCRSGTTRCGSPRTWRTIDMISRGRLVTGWVRGTGRESVAHNAAARRTTGSVSRKPTTSSSTPGRRDGPFRWEGEHYNYRYVNPWSRPYQIAAPARSGFRAS